MTRNQRILLAGLILAALILIFPTIGHCTPTCQQLAQVTLTGTIGGANGLPASNYTMTLVPSQQGFIAGCQVNIPTNNTCATSTDGSVVFLPNPQTATVNTTGGSGSLGSGVYYTVYAWYYQPASTVLYSLPSPETVQTLSTTGALVVNPPSSGVPTGALGMAVYISTVSGAEKLQGYTTGSASFVQSTALANGALVPASNMTVCAVTANDSIWPTGTGYNVSLTDQYGNPVPGYPMQWQLMGAGSTTNLSNGLPYYHGVVYYPVPILSAPANHGQQSISGPLNLGGYNLTGVGKLGVGTGTPGWGVDVEGAGLAAFINAAGGYLVNGGGGTAGYCLSSDGTAYDTGILCGGFYQTVQSAGTAQPQELNLNFASGFTVVDDPSNHRTNVSVAAPSVAKVQLSLPATTVNANTCSTPAVVTLTGTYSNATCTASYLHPPILCSTFSTAFATNPVAAVGWGANGGLVVELWPDATDDNTLDWSICNQTASNITPTAITLNVGVN